MGLRCAGILDPGLGFPGGVTSGFARHKVAPPMRRHLLLSLVPVVLFLTSCGNKPVAQWLLPTPVMYLDGSVRPFDHLPASQQSTETEVFYATNRVRVGTRYGAGMTKELRFGIARMRMGSEDESWASLVDASTEHPRQEPMSVRVNEASEVATESGPNVGGWLRRVDQAVMGTSTRDLVIYVHGAKVGFEHSCAFAAELQHFSGRDVVAVAFDWPTHRELVSYVDGVDLRHAQQSSAKLADLVELLAKGTRARKIHIVSWSAGARVLSRALDELGRDRSHSMAKDLRIGAAVFAAGDVPERDFQSRLEAIERVTERVIVYVSDDDFALRWSSRLMGGGRRLGMEWDDFGPKRMAFLKHHPTLEIVDTSYGKETRGFDIRGHRYWFQHPWVNSDLILALRTDQPAAKRGLSRGEIEGLFYFASDYDKKIGGVAKRLTGGAW